MDNVMEFKGAKVTEEVKENTPEVDAEKMNETVMKKLKGHVTRKEFIEVMQQLTDNFNLSNQYLMEDMNVMYKNHLFPFELKVYVLEDLLIKNGLTTEEELSKLYNERLFKMQQQAKEIKEKQDKVESEASASTESSESK